MASPSPASAEVTAEPLLALSQLTKRFGSFTALSEVSLDLRPGEVHCILGENGAGKSTLMSILYGFYQADAGEIRLGGRPVRIDNSADAIRLESAMMLMLTSSSPSVERP